MEMDSSSEGTLLPHFKILIGSELETFNISNAFTGEGGFRKSVTVTLKSSVVDSRVKEDSSSLDCTLSPRMPPGE